MLRSFVVVSSFVRSGVVVAAALRLLQSMLSVRWPVDSIASCKVDVIEGVNEFSRESVDGGALSTNAICCGVVVQTVRCDSTTRLGRMRMGAKMGGG